MPTSQSCLGTAPVSPADCYAGRCAGSRRGSTPSRLSRRCGRKSCCLTPGSAVATHCALTQTAPASQLSAAAPRPGHSCSLRTCTALRASNGNAGASGTASIFERLSQGSMAVVTAAVAEASRLSCSEVRACGSSRDHPLKPAPSRPRLLRPTRSEHTTCCSHSHSTVATRRRRCRKLGRAQTACGERARLRRRWRTYLRWRR
jgi:hypothetical protein